MVVLVAGFVYLRHEFYSRLLSTASKAATAPQQELKGTKSLGSPGSRALLSQELAGGQVCSRGSRDVPSPSVSVGLPGCEHSLTGPRTFISTAEMVVEVEVKTQERKHGSVCVCVRVCLCAHTHHCTTVITFPFSHVVSPPVPAEPDMLQCSLTDVKTKRLVDAAPPTHTRKPSAEGSGGIVCVCIFEPRTRFVSLGGGIGSIASDVGITVEELLSLNAHIQDRNLVHTNTPVHVWGERLTVTVTAGGNPVEGASVDVASLFTNTNSIHPMEIQLYRYS